MMQQSSMTRAMCGRVELTSMPLWPYLANVSGEGMKPEPLLFLKRSPVGCWPANFARAGLGSKVSTCEGPPFMKRKITRLARGLKSGVGRGDARDDDDNDVSAFACGASSAANAAEPKPAAVRWSIWRRLSGKELIDIKRLVRSQ